MDHNNWAQHEHLEYFKIREKFILHPQEFCPIFVDGADQSTFKLPNFMVKTECERGHAIKVGLFCLFRYSRENKFRLFTITEEHKTGAIYVVGTVHCFLDCRATAGLLPRSLFI